MSVVIAQTAVVDPRARLGKDVRIGHFCVIGPDVTIQDVVIMGADYYETEKELAANEEKGIPPIGIGEGCSIRRALIDKNARIGKNVTIRAIEDREDEDHENWVSRDSIVIVPKNAVIPDNTVI